MPTPTLRPTDPTRDFADLAAWFTILDEWPNSCETLTDYYNRERERIIEAVAVGAHDAPLGFYWVKRDPTVPEHAFFYLYVSPEHRGHGIGHALYDAMLQAIAATAIRRLQTRVGDTCPECRAFADRRGFTEIRHGFTMALDLDAFDDAPYNATLARLEREGFRFTSMAELGNTPEAQQALYRLNDATARDIPGTGGEPSWASFEDFQSSVCQADWYIPDGQKLAIDTANGAFAALSAITRPPGADYAYNLHTGVARAYRGRKLGQAVKVIALRYARAALGVHTVRTHHNVHNLPMIAIDRKLGYVRLPGTYLMEKALP